jgi:hypothetical protein
MTLFNFLAQVLDLLFEAWPLWMISGAGYSLFKSFDDEGTKRQLDWGWKFLILIGVIFLGRLIIYLGMGDRQFSLVMTEPQYTYWCFFFGGLLVLLVASWKVVKYMAQA